MATRTWAERASLIVAHDNVRKRMSIEQFIAVFDTKVPASPAAALPVVTFNDTVTFHLNGEEIHAFHVPPAHTDGDAIVHFRQADVVHMGDLFFNGSYPFIDVVERRLARGDDRRRGPGAGHGEGRHRRSSPGTGRWPSGPTSAFRDMLAAVRDRVKPLVAAGKTLAEVQAAKPTAAFDEKWGKGFIKPDQILAIAYTSLGGKKK